MRANISCGDVGGMTKRQCTFHIVLHLLQHLTHAHTTNAPTPQDLQDIRTADEGRAAEHAERLLPAHASDRLRIASST